MVHAPAEWSQVKLRIPRELHEWLKHAAINNRRTLNGEVEFRLIESRREASSQEAKQ